MPAYNPDTNINRDSNLVSGDLGESSDSYWQAEPAESHAPSNNCELDAIETLHNLCGIYTKPELVKSLLDRVGWKVEADLSKASLLEPGAGDGAFLVEAAERLVFSFVRQGINLDIGSLRDRILAYELIPNEAIKARARIFKRLRELRVHHRTAWACVTAWVRTEDFLLAELPHSDFSHIVGNPPYIRWSKIPKEKAAAYGKSLPQFVARGDLYLPFLHRSFEHLATEGRCAFVCSDRWRYTLYAHDFRQKWCRAMHISTETAGEPREIFDRDAFVQPEILTATPQCDATPPSPRKRKGGSTLGDLGCTIRVGPALGVTQAFVLGPEEDGVEAELLHPWLDSRNIAAGSIQPSGHRVVSVFREDGTLIDLESYPEFASRLRRFEDRLRVRHIVRNGSPWYRSIDKIVVADWAGPKLLIPEVAKVPRIAIDRSGAIPSHGVYSVFFPGGDIEEIYDRLRDGKLARALSPIAPRIKGGYTRCYRRFLAMMRI